MRRFPKFHYSYVAVDPSHTRRLSLDPRLTVVPYDGHNLRTPLRAFIRICRAMVPNAHHEEIVLSPATHVCTLIASRNGDVVGGTTFRMLTAHPIKTGAAVPRLILEIVLMAVRMEDHGHGIGTKLVLHAKAIATAHAAQSTPEGCPDQGHPTQTLWASSASASRTPKALTQRVHS